MNIKLVVSSSKLVMFFLLYRHTDDGIFDDFPKVSEDFPKLFRRSDECSGTFSKISEDFRKLPKTFEEDPKMFRSNINEFKYNLRNRLDISEIIDIFTREDMENTPLESRMYEFYEWCIFQ